MDGDRERWNAKWRERAGELETASTFLTANAPLFPLRGKALDLAGGAGRNAMWLARRGLDVTLVDISDVALDEAERKAAGAGVAKKPPGRRRGRDPRAPAAATSRGGSPR